MQAKQHGGRWLTVTYQEIVTVVRMRQKPLVNYCSAFTTLLTVGLVDTHAERDRGADQLHVP